MMAVETVPAEPKQVSWFPPILISTICSPYLTGLESVGCRALFEGLGLPDSSLAVGCLERPQVEEEQEVKMEGGRFQEVGG